jgi:uroporphyrinogen-III synthase
VRILLTRPKADAERTATALRARGHDVVIAPLLDIELLSDPDLGAGPWRAILVTSANAVRAIAQHRRRDELRGVAVFTVGQHTAQAMRNAGFTDVASADGNVTDLAKLVAGRVKSQERLLYLAGEERSGDLGGLLRAQDFAVHTALIYRAVAARTLPGYAAAAVQAGIHGVLHFSRRSAEAYVSAVHEGGLQEAGLTRPVHFCLSARVAEPLKKAGVDHIRVASRPDEAALIELCS